MKHLILASLVGLVAFCHVLAQEGLDTIGFQNTMKNFNTNEALVVIGEAHEVKGTYDTELFLIKEMAKTGHHTLIIEGGVSEAIILNNYLNNKDISYLNYTRARGKNYQKLILGIEGLTKTKQIEFIGIDFERAICLDFLFKQWFKPISNPELHPIIGKLRKITASTSAKKLKKILLEVKTIYPTHQEALSQELGKMEKWLRQIVFNPVFQADFGMTSKKRDQGMLKQLLNISPEILKQSVFIIGSNHITTNNYLWPHFIKEKPASVEVKLFVFAYKECTNFLKPGQIYSSQKPLNDFFVEERTNQAQIKFEQIPPRSPSLFKPLTETILVKLSNQ